MSLIVGSVKVSFASLILRGRSTEKVSTMFNSLSKYLWGSNSGNGTEYSDHSCPPLAESPDGQYNQQEPPESEQEEDWVVVQAAERNIQGRLTHRSPCHQCTHTSQLDHTVTQTTYSGGQDSLSQNSSGASDAELLDDADALAQSISDEYLRNQSVDNCIDIGPLLHPDCEWSTQDADRYSDTESLPESVFSACSGRSHATYRPGGSQSEPWLVAPPPCFTGSQVGSLSPIASSPLENLLIEHPSMSVYLSLARPQQIVSSQPLSELTPFIEETNSEFSEPGEASSQRDENSVRTAENQVLNETLQQRNPGTQAAAIPADRLLAHHLLKQVHLAQQMQCLAANRMISRGRCDHENKTKDHQSHGKGANRRNKRVCPSGFKFSRFGQRMY